MLFKSAQIGETSQSSTGHDQEIIRQLARRECTQTCNNSKLTHTFTCYVKEWQWHAKDSVGCHKLGTDDQRPTYQPYIALFMGCKTAKVAHPQSTLCIFPHIQEGIQGCKRNHLRYLYFLFHIRYDKEVKQENSK